MNKYRKDARPGGMTMRTQIRTAMVMVVAIAVFFSLIVIPTKPNWLPGHGFWSSFYPHLGLDLQGGTHLVYEADMTAIPGSDRDSALEGVRDVIERRINTIGVAEPLVQTTRQSGKWRVAVELAGVQDVNQAITLIGETPLLEFKELGAATTTPAVTSEQLTAIEKANKEKERLAKDIIARLQKNEDFAALSKQYNDDVSVKDAGGDLGWVVRGKFVEAFDKALFDELKDGQLTKTPVRTEFGYHIIKRIESRKNDKGELEVHSAHILLKTETAQPQPQQNWVGTELSGKQLKRAQVVFDPTTGQPEVSLVFNSEGADLFKQITERNVGKQVAIFLDGQIISAPVVQNVITGGEALISGNFTLDESKLLAQRLNAGALPVPVLLLSQQTVGSTLGRDSLQKSLNAGLVATILVALFMIMFYRLPGLISVIALSIYAVITFGLFEMIPVTLTLAGIAGFILSIGMAVDANILIFERVKEELARGMEYAQAIEEGFKRAWTSIRDSNASSLITCVILYWFGSSIIKGFAVTLAIGILVSLFSAITVTRTLLRIIIKSKMVKKQFLFGYRKSNVS